MQNLSCLIKNEGKKYKDFSIFTNSDQLLTNNKPLMQNLNPITDGNSNIKKGLHSVVIWFDYGLEDDELFYSLSLELGKVLENTEIGIYDGHEIAMDNTDGSYYMYGPNAETLFKAVLPTLEKYDFMKGSIAELCFGDGEESARIEVEV